jgi:large subunit ribosomal protein L18
MKLESRTDYRGRRHLRLRKKIRGSAARPRMSVMVSNKHMYVQFIDDDAAVTLAAVSTQAEGLGARKNVAGAKLLGHRAAAVAKEKGIATVVFDRGGYRFHGRVKAIADGAREAGLQF